MALFGGQRCIVIWSSASGYVQHFNPVGPPWHRGRGPCAAPCHAKHKSRCVVIISPSHLQVREGARRIARLEAALAEARARNPSIGASSHSRSAGAHATSREARLANEMQARNLPLALIVL